MIPEWIASPVREFGRTAGLPDLALDDRGVAAISFETGMTLRFEFAGDALAIAATVPAGGGAATARAILSYAHPGAQGRFPVRCARRAKTNRAIFAILLPARSVTTESVAAAFAELWRIATEFGGTR